MNNGLEQEINNELLLLEYMINNKSNVLDIVSKIDKIGKMFYEYPLYKKYIDLMRKAQKLDIFCFASDEKEENK